MPTSAPVSIVPVSDKATVPPVKGGASAAADGFLSLLNTVGKPDAVGKSEVSVDRSRSDKDQDDVVSPVAVAVEGRNEPARDDVSRSDIRDNTNDTIEVDDTNDVKPSFPDDEPQAKNEQPQTKNDTRVGAPSSETTGSEGNEASDIDVNPATISEADDRPTLKAHLDSVDQLLSATLVALSAQPSDRAVIAVSNIENNSNILPAFALPAASSASSVTQDVPNVNIPVINAIPEDQLVLQVKEDDLGTLPHVGGKPITSGIIGDIPGNVPDIARALANVASALSATENSTGVPDAVDTETVSEDAETLGQLVKDIVSALTQGKKDPSALPTNVDVDALEETQAVVRQLQDFLQSTLPRERPSAADQETIKSLLGDLAEQVKQLTVGKEVSTLAKDVEVKPVSANIITPQFQPAQSNVVTQSNAATVAAVFSQTDFSQNGNSGSGGNQQQSGHAFSTPMQGIASAGQPLGASAANSSFSRVLNDIAPKQGAAVAEQVVFHVKTALADGSSRISIQLDPVELGKLDIKLHINSDGKTAVVVTADNQDTLSILQRDAQGLAKVLADAGLKTDAGSLSFNLRGGDQQQSGKEGGSPQLSTYQKAQPEDDDLETLNAISRSYVVDLAEGLDIKI